MNMKLALILAALTLSTAAHASIVECNGDQQILIDTDRATVQVGGAPAQSINWYSKSDLSELASLVKHAESAKQGDAFILKASTPSGGETLFAFYATPISRRQNMQVKLLVGNLGSVDYAPCSMQE
jgi:hypothetical protein